MADPPRSIYLLRLHELRDPPPMTADVRLRTVLDGDDAALGRLMERAYAGTIDDDLGDNDDGLVEIQQWRRDGGAAELSTVAVDTDLVSAALLTRTASGRWWLAYVYTDPAVTARGVAAAVSARSLRLAHGAGALEVQAAVTDGNEPSERLLRGLGFERTGSA